MFAAKPDGMSSTPAPERGRRKPTPASCPLTYTPTRMCHSMHKPPHTVTSKNTKAWFYHCYFSLLPHWRQNPDTHCTCLLVLPTPSLRNKNPEWLPKKSTPADGEMLQQFPAPRGQLQVQGIQCLLLTSAGGRHTYIHTCRQNTQIHKIKSKLEVVLSQPAVCMYICVYNKDCQTKNEKIKNYLLPCA